MNTQEILKFCLERGFLLDKEVLSMFNETNDEESVKLIIQRVKESTNQKIITKSLFNQNRDKVFQILSTLPKENQQQLEGLKIKLGLSIEISREISKPIQVEKPNEVMSPVEGVRVLSSILGKTKKLEVGDFTKYFRGRVSEMKKILQENSSLKNLVSINKLSNTRQSLSVIGIVSSKTITKNKNLIFEVEDLTGTIKVLVSPSNAAAYEKAEEICLDSVLGFSGFGSREIIFCSQIVFPEASIVERKHSPYDENALFLGDIHYGSSLFLEDKFEKFIDYINGKVPNTPEAEKIKYLFLVGDVIAGVGIHPTQERELKVKDIEEQFIGLTQLLSKIRKDIKIIISPGNHDGVRLMEPQPLLNERYAWSIYNLKNVILTGNPALVNIGARNDFSGIDVLTYHGVSFHYYANSVPKLIKQGGVNAPNKIMAYLLQNRHLAPSHTSAQYYPAEEDLLMIKKIPDIIVSGHTHKSGVAYYNNILTISASSWESKTPYQEKMGNHPDFCKVPMVNLKTRTIKILDFEGAEDKEEKIEEGK